MQSSRKNELPHERKYIVHYLYARKRDAPYRLVATFDSEQQLKAYVGWATLESHGPNAGKYEQGSVLAGFNEWTLSQEPLTEEDPTEVVHSPTPTML